MKRSKEETIAAIQVIDENLANNPGLTKTKACNDAGIPPSTYRHYKSKVMPNEPIVEIIPDVKEVPRIGGTVGSEVSSKTEKNNSQGGLVDTLQTAFDTITQAKDMLKQYDKQTNPVPAPTLIRKNRPPSVGIISSPSGPVSDNSSISEVGETRTNDIDELNRIIDEQVRSAKSILEKTGWRTVKQENPATVDEATQILISRGYTVKDPRLSKEEVDQLMKKKEEVWKKTHHAEIEAKLEAQKIDAATGVIDKLIDKIMSIFNPVISKMFETELSSTVPDQPQAPTDDIGLTDEDRALLDDPIEQPAVEVESTGGE